MIKDSKEDSMVVGFEGFDPTQDVRQAVRNLTDELFSEAPSESFLAASFSKVGGVFKGMIRITSRVGHFIVEASDQQPSLLIKNLFERMQKELGAWKERRFD